MVTTAKGSESDDSLKSWNNLAQLVGYRQEDVKGAVLRSESDTSLLDEADDLPAINTVTKTPFWKNPLAKASLVSVVMGIVVGSFGLGYMMFSGKLDSAKSPVYKPSTAKDETPVFSERDTELGKAKAAAALGTQSQTIAQAEPLPTLSKVPDSAKSSTTGKTGKSEVRPQSKATAIGSIQPTPYRVQSSGRTNPVLYQRTHPSSSANSTESVAVRSPGQTDPHKVWQQALALGSYGDGSTLEKTSANTQTVTTASKDVSKSSPQLDTKGLAEMEAVMTGEPVTFVQLLPGTTTDGVLKTPILWARDLDAQRQPQRFSLQIDKPLLASNGAIAFPPGTVMIVKVDQMSNSGMMQLSVVGIVSQEKLIEVPEGVLTVAGSGGNALVAKEHRTSKGTVNGMSIKKALFGALAQVGVLLNRPDQYNTTTSPYLSSTSVSNGSTNIAGGILQGAFGSLSEDLRERQDDEIDDIVKRPSLWVLDSGKKVQLFVTKPYEVKL